MERRLAAILVADVVGFSRLMEADEAGTLAALRERRTMILEPVVKEHRGRIVKLMGDGALIEHASAVNAVAAAIELQKRMAAANEGVAEERRIVLRIGINLGDVIGEGSDIYGEGVNVAARLETLAEPGGICVSGKVYQEVSGKTSALFEDMGEQSLKNISAPVRAYRLRQGMRPAAAAPIRKESTKPAVAVLPFDNMSGDPDQEYFSDGITEDIITAISRFRSLFVIARNSSFAFRGQQLTVPEIAKRLGVDYVLEGSVRRAGNRVRISAQLIEAASGNHVWSERYDRSLEDIFAVQEEVATVIASTLSGQVRADIANRATRKHPDSFLVYDYALRGIQLQQKSTRYDADAGRVLLEKAIELDPGYAEAYPWLALCHLALWGYDLDKAALATATAIALRGVALDDNSAICHIIVAYCGLYNREFQLSRFHHERACALNPNDAYVATHMGLFLAYTGRAAESSIWFENGLRLNPFPPTWYVAFAGRAAYVDRRYADAAKSLDAPTESVKSLMYLAAALGQLGRIAEARTILDACARLKPAIPIIKFAEAEPFQNPADNGHLIDGLRKAGLEV